MDKNHNVERELEYYAKLPYTLMIEQWDDGNEPYWVARIAELPHCLIHAGTPEEAAREIQEVKMDWIRSNLQRGLKIPEPRPRQYSGQIRLRIPPSLHRLLSYGAEMENVSLNQYMAINLAKSVGHLVEEEKLRLGVRKPGRRGQTKSGQKQERVVSS